MKHVALSADVGREARLVPEGSPLKAFHGLGFCTCLCVFNWQMLALLLRDIDYQRKWPPLIELKVDFFFSLNKYWEGGEMQEPCGCGQNSAETSAFWTAGFSCN